MRIRIRLQSKEPRPPGRPDRREDRLSRASPYGCGGSARGGSQAEPEPLRTCGGPSGRKGRRGVREVELVGGMAWSQRACIDHGHRQRPGGERGVGEGGGRRQRDRAGVGSGAGLDTGARTVRVVVVLMMVLGPRGPGRTVLGLVRVLLGRARGRREGPMVGTGVGPVRVRSGRPEEEGGDDYRDEPLRYGSLALHGLSVMSLSEVLDHRSAEFQTAKNDTDVSPMTQGGGKARRRRPDPGLQLPSRRKGDPHPHGWTAAAPPEHISAR